MLPLRLPGPVYSAIVEYAGGPEARSVINEWYSRTTSTDGDGDTFELRHDYRYVLRTINNDVVVRARNET